MLPRQILWSLGQDPEEPDRHPYSAKSGAIGETKLKGGTSSLHLSVAQRMVG